jgi:MFS family permease
VLIEDPTVIAVGDRDRAAQKAKETRTLALKLDVGLLWFFGFGAGLSAWQYRRAKRTGRTERQDRGAYRARLVLSGLWIAPLIALIFAHHWLEGRALGESPWPVLLGVVLTLGILAGTGWYVQREGQEKTNERSRRILRWAVPLAISVASIRLLAWLVARR